MSFGNISNLYVIGRYLDDSFLKESFKSTDVFSDYIADQTFTREITSGALDLSAFTNVSETFTVTNLTFKLIPNNSSDIEIELKYSGQVQFNKSSSSDSHYSSFSTSGLRPTIEILDKRNGGNTLLTNLFTFDQINISGTGYFETINDVINIALVRDEVDLRYDSLDIDFTNASNEAIAIDLKSLATDTYDAIKSVNGVNVETTVIGVDNGDASFSIAGTFEGGNTLSISQDAVDPDGTGTLSYSWQISSDNSTWSVVGTSATYAIADSDQGKKIRAVISYTDNEGHSEQITTVSKDIFFAVADNTTEGITASGGSGNDLLIGSKNNDTLDGGDGNDEIQGGDGDDTIYGGEGADTIYGGDGDDNIRGGKSSYDSDLRDDLDVIYGGDGDDTIYGFGKTTIYGDGGDDTISAVDYNANTRDLVVYGGDGDDNINARSFKSVDAGDGDDIVQMSQSQGGWESNDLKTIPLEGGAGYDELRFGWYGWSGSELDWSVINGFEKITFQNGDYANEIFTDNVGQSGTNLYLNYTHSGSFGLDASAESDATITIEATNTRYTNRVTSGQLADTITLGSGDDIVDAKEGNDTINTGEGADTITGGAGNDTIDGGLGTDIAIFSGNKSNYTIEEVAYAQYLVTDNQGTDGVDSLKNIETLQFSDQNFDITPAGQNLTGTNSEDNLTGLTGDDLIIGLGGNDTLDGGDGNDEIQGGDGDDTIYGGEGADTIYGGDGDDNIRGGKSSYDSDLRDDLDVIYGGDGDDTIYGFGKTTIYGDGGDDTISAVDYNANTRDLVVYGGDGDDNINARSFKSVDAGDGDDIVQMSQSQGGWESNDLKTIPLEGGAGYDELRFGWYGWSGSELDWSVINGFEKITFQNGDYANEIFTDNVGQSGTNLYLNYTHSGSFGLDASAESDATITIEATNTRYTNRVTSGQLADTITLGSGDDIVDAKEGNDTINTGEGADTITGGAGDDTIDGGLGTDIAIFSGNKSNYTIEEVAYAQYLVTDNQGTDGVDSLKNIETLQFSDQNFDITPAGQNLTGTNSEDNLTGLTGDDLIIGLGGNDTLDGGDGNDEIQGGDGDDTIYGGEGADTIYGGDGDDNIRGGKSSYDSDLRDDLDVIYGGDGDDTIYGFGKTTIYGDGGDDTISAVDYNANTRDLVVYGGDGDDNINARSFKSVDAGDGDDIVQMSQSQGGWESNDLKTIPLEGGAGYDELRFGWYGWSGSELDWSVINGFEKITFQNGDYANEIFTDNVGQSGTNLYLNYTHSGSFGLDASAESDATITIEATNTRYTNRVTSGQLADTITLGSGDDIVDAKEGNDTINTGEGADTITGGAGDDTIDGGQGNDIAIFSGNKSDYTITETGYGEYQVVDNRGDAFIAADISTEKQWVQTVFIEDLNNDGHLDIIASGYNYDDSDVIIWHKNDGNSNPSFTSATLGYGIGNTFSVISADIDGDGDSDIISGGEKIAWHENNGSTNPTFSTNEIESGDHFYLRVFAADLDSDGDLDILASTQSDGIFWYENDGSTNPSFSEHIIDSNAGQTYAVHAADIDNDGNIDIAASRYAHEIDANGDGNEWKIIWYKGDGAANPSFSSNDVAIVNTGLVRDVYVADIDSDGDLDIASAQGRGTVEWYENNGEANPSWSVNTITSSSSNEEKTDVHVADMDSDGDMDILSLSQGENTVSWYENNGAEDPTFTAADIANNAEGAYELHTGDLDGDGDLDVVSASYMDHAVAWYENFSSDGTDSLTSIKTLRFADQDVDITPAGMTISNTGQGTLSSITGSPVVGGTITAGDVTGDPDGMPSNPNYSYQWQVASNNVWTDINGNDESRDYVPLAEHVNKSLRVKVTYTDGVGTRGYIYSDPVNIYIPDSTSPTIINSQISNDGSELILTFSENIIYSTPYDNHLSLQVTVNGSTNNPIVNVVSANNHTDNKLYLTLLNKILNGQEVTFDHTFTGNNNIQTIKDSTGNYVSSITSLSVTNNSDVIGFVNGQPYEGDFHLMDNGMKMTGASHGSSTDQIIYSTIAESTSSGGTNTGNPTLNIDYGSETEGLIDLSTKEASEWISDIWGPGSNGIVIGGDSRSGGLNYSTEPGVGWSEIINGVYTTSFSIQSDDGYNDNDEWTWISDPETGSWMSADGSNEFKYLTYDDLNNSVTVSGPAQSIIQIINLETIETVGNNDNSPGSDVVFYPLPNTRYGGYAWYSDNRQDNIEIRAETNLKIDWENGDPGGGHNWWEKDYETEETADINDLVQVRRGEKGDAVYTNNVQNDYDKKTYILQDNDTSNDPILITESWGGAAYLNDSWMGGSREVYAVEELSAGGYIIAIKEIIDDQWSNGERLSWQTIQTSATGVLDWNNSSYTDDIAGSETKFNEDLNNDGAIGVDTSNLTLKTEDTAGEKLAVNSSGSLFIVTSAGAYIPIVEEWSGSSITLDESQSWEGGGSFKREALYVGLDNKGTAGDTSDDRYALAVKETNTHSWGGQTHVDEHWVVYDVKTDGSFDWMGTWGAEIADYEVIFDQDIDGDGSKGVDLSNLEKITTDTYGVELKRGSGSLYIVDGDTTLKVKDDYGSNPRLEDSNTWEGGSYSSVGYAVEKKADGSYTLVIKFTETFDDDFFAGEASGSAANRTAMSAYEVHSISSSGVLSWENASFTTAIGSYEPILGQDIDGDGHIGVDLGSLTDITTDTVSHRLKVDAAGSLYIWDGSDSSSLLAIKDAAGGSPSMKSSFGEAGDDFSYSMDPIAVVKIDDYYRVAIKHTDTYKFDGESEVNINWEVYKIKSDGEIDWSGQIWTESITSWEDEFDLDLNGDGDKSGQVSLTNRTTDTTGAILASEGANGALYIVDGSTQIAINDSWIESSSNWGDGSYSSTAIAVSDVNNNGTAGDTSDDYYQVAVKNANTWTDWQSGQKTTSEDWQVYAIYASGSNQGNNNWDKTVWTQSIQSYETTFQQDLDGDGVTGLNLSNLKTASGDTSGWLLKKDSKNSLYISDSNGENIKTVKDEYGGTPNFDYSSNWGSGSSSSEAIAAEINADNTFSIAIKHTHTFGSETNTDWEILTVSNSGVLDWSKSVWTQSIQPYEKAFGQDLDGDGSQGLNLGQLSSVDTDTYSDVLKKDSNGNFFILTEAGEHIAITESWGGGARFDYSDQWEGGSWSSKAVAVEDITYTHSDGYSVNGYVIAIKNTGSYGSDQFTDWELRYTDGKGVIDWNNSIWMQSIKSKESLFGTNAAQADLDGDGAFGLSADALTAVSSDTAGDLLKKDDGNALYIIDNKDTADTSDDVTIAITDQWGGTPTFDWSDSGGSGDYAWAYSSAAYAVESFDDSGIKKFLLAIKSTDTWEGQQNIFWETYVIKESSSGAGDWALDWSSGTWSKAIGKKESVFGQDIDGDGSVYSASSVTTTAVSTDTSTTANTAVTLTKDAQGGLYITKGSTNILIVDSSDAAVAFDWSQTWAGETRTSIAYAVEGIDSDSDNTIDKYKLAVKHELKNNSSNAVTNQWQTIEISTAGVVDWSTETFGEAKLHEADLNQDLDGDGKIWSATSEVLTAVSSDTKGALAYLDSSKNLFIASGSGQTKQAVLDFSGGLISFNETYSLGNFTDKREVLAVESATVGGTDYYKVLIKNTTSSASESTTAYETVNIKQSTMIVDWGTFSYYVDPKKLESAFQIDIDGDGTITTISSSSTTAIATDTTGAQLRQTSDGSLFIKDGDSTFQITSPDGGYVDLTFTDTFTDGSFKSEAIAVQKVGNDYKLVVKETATFGSNTDISYLVYKLTSAGLIDWGDVTYRTTAELNESEFGQDITGDGNISNGSTSEASDTFADAVTTSNTDAKVLEQFSNTAQSDIYSIANSDSSSSDSKIEMFVKGVDGSAKTDYTMDVSIVQEASAAVLGKVAADTGVSSSNIKALTGVMDFNVTIPDASNYGKIVSLSWVLPDDTRNPVYFKKDPATGEYFDFQFNSETGEGAKWDDSSKTLTVYVRDNGKYDADTTLGKVRDPGMIGDSGDSSDTTAANITGPSGSAGDSASAKSIAENTTTIHTFTANETVSWSFNGGADASKFSIDSSTGALSFLAAPDYENPTDNGLNNEYVVVVRATDNGSNTSDQTVTVTVTNVDDTNPLIQGNTGSAGATTSTKTVSENQTTVHTFTADETVTWSLNGGADSSKFAINSSTGALSFSSAPDFENPTDANSGNDYVVIVKATDSQGNISNQTVTVSVSNIIEAGESGSTTFSKSINENTTTVHTFTADETVTWSLNGGADVSKFSIDSSTGALTLNSGADYENPADANTDNDYVVVVRSTDGSSNTLDQTTTITILDVDETPAQITGSSGSAGAAASAKSIQENVTGVHGFTANETVTWSLNGGADASLFDINSSSGTLSFKAAPDYENPTDNDKNNEYVVVVRATDDQNNTSDQTHTVTITDIGEKTNSSDTFYRLSYKKADNSSTITPIFSPTFGTINGALTLNRLSSAPTISNKPSGLSIGQTGINFELLLSNSAIDNKGKTTTDLTPLVDGLTTTGKNIAYFSYDEVNGAPTNTTTLTYDPTKKAGARFYDLNGDGNADTVNLELVDGGYGDKDRVKDGKIVDPSTAGVVDLTPAFTASSTALTVADATDTTSPAAFNLSVSISSNASTVNQIGYVALNSNESDTLTYDLIKNRGSILLSNVENSDTPNLSSMDLTADISLINTQKLVFFEVIDTTLENLLANNTNLDEFGSSFKILNLSDTTTNSANASNGGNTIAISLQQGFSGVNDLIASDLGFNPILDFSGFAGLSLEGSVSVAREAKYNSTVGFYKIQNSNGAVSDPITGDLITPGTSGYAEAALNSSNLFSSLGTLSTSNGNTITSSITSFSDAEMIAPYASVHDTGQTYFSFTEANADGISHFREFGNGVIGLEDLNGGGDNDFDDLIFGFDLKLTV